MSSGMKSLAERLSQRKNVKSAKLLARNSAQIFSAIIAINDRRSVNTMSAKHAIATSIDWYIIAPRKSITV
jgi:hypothetical protein